MTFSNNRQKTIKVILILTTFLLMTTGTVVLANDLPSHIKQAVEDEFPGAVITEARQELWQGEMMYEVEIKSIDGKEYELIISREGKIVKTQLEKGLPFIGGELSIGAGVLVESDIYKGTDTETGAAVFFRYENGNLEIQTSDALEIAYTFYRTGGLMLSAKSAVFFGAGYDVDESSFLTGMDELDTFYSAGLSAQWDLNGWELGFEVLQDISGEHDGREIELSVAKTWTAASFEFTPSISLSWMSSDMVDYLYGVSTSEARVDRPAYSPGGSYEAELELMIQRPLFADFTAVGIAAISTFGSEITDSPIVDEDYATQFVLGVIYHF